MSVGVLRYSRPNAEIRGLVSRLLSRPEWEALAAFSGAGRAPGEALADALRLLERTAYASIATELLRAGPTINTAERAVEGTLVDAFWRISGLLPGPPGALIEEMARRLELDNLKVILRGVARRQPAAQIRPLLTPLGRLGRLPLEEPLRAENVPAVVEALSGTPYGRVLRHALPRFQREDSLFALEVALDLDYYRRLWSVGAALPGADRELALRLMGVQYDLLNVEWIIRFRLIYRLSPEEIFNYTLPYGYRLRDDDVRRAASADDLAALAAALPEPYRGLLAPVARAPDGLDRAGIVLHRHQVGVARRALTGYPFHIGVAIAYLWLKEAEVHDLKALFEGLRYGQPPEQIVAATWGVA